MNTSVCITVLNEESSIGRLLDSLLNQTKLPNEVIIVDGGSNGKTIEIIKHYQKKDKSIKLLREHCSRARGRNLGVDIAKGGIIAMTDAGCVAERHWLERITDPFKNSEIQVVAGFYNMVSSYAYKMKAENDFEKAESVFLGVLPNKFDNSFLPSTRSIAFRKEIWEKVGGFPENLNDAAEDTVFNYKLVKNKIRISRVKDAVVEWGMPKNIKEFFWKVFKYSKGDAKSKIWIFPGKGITSHNIKAIFVLVRYILGIILLIYSIFHTSLLALFLILLLIYLFLAFKKASYWGIVLQLVSDFGVMAGFISGIIS